MISCFLLLAIILPCAKRAGETVPFCFDCRQSETEILRLIDEIADQDAASAKGFKHVTRSRKACIAKQAGAAQERNVMKHQQLVKPVSTFRKLAPHGLLPILVGKCSCSDFQRRTRDGPWTQLVFEPRGQLRRQNRKAEPNPCEAKELPEGTQGYKAAPIHIGTSRTCTPGVTS